MMFVARAIDRTAGGVERIITAVMNAMVARGHEVDLLTWDLAGAEAFYPMASSITWHRLNLGDPNVRAGNRLMLRRAHEIRANISRRKPLVIVCFQDGPFMAIRAYTLGIGIPVIAAERNSPSRFEHITAGKSLIYQSFRFAARLLIQCESYRTLYPNFLQHKIVCIPNPVSRAAVQARPDLPGSHGRFRLLSVGRLGFQKNYEVLIEAFAHLLPKFPDWELVIVGDGEARSELEALIKRRGLESKVTLPGTTNSIADWYASSHLFCLASRWEGFPNALAEALAHGLPAVGFAECAGVRDLIDEGRSGLLAVGSGDVVSLARTLETAMSRTDLRRSMSSQAVDSIRRFDPAKIFGQWEDLLVGVAHGWSDRFAA
jgi:glycosyltransferase involved in cell wall biosynthesis